MITAATELTAETVEQNVIDWIVKPNPNAIEQERIKNGFYSYEESILQRVTAFECFRPVHRPGDCLRNRLRRRNAMRALFLDCFDLAGLAFHASILGYDYSEHLLCRLQGDYFPDLGGAPLAIVPPRKLLEIHDKLYALFHRIGKHAVASSLEYSAAAQRYERHTELNGLRAAICGPYSPDSSWRDDEFYEVHFSSQECYGGTRRMFHRDLETIKAKIEEQGLTLIYCEHEHVRMCYNATFLPSEVPDHVVLQRWQTVMQADPRSSDLSIFPLGKSFWREALNFEAEHLAIMAEPAVELRRAEADVQQSGLTAVEHRKRVEKLEELRAIVRDLEATSKRLYTNAARRERLAVRDAMHRAGYTMSTEAVGFEPGGMCGLRHEIIDKTLDHNDNVGPPDVCGDDAARFPWPPPRGASAFKEALESWRASKLESGGWMQAQGDYVYNQCDDSEDSDASDSESESDRSDSRDELDCESEDITKPLPGHVHEHILNHANAMKANTVPRCNATKLPWYNGFLVVPPCIDDPDMSYIPFVTASSATPLGDVFGHEQAMQALCRIVSGFTNENLEAFCKRIKTLAMHHNQSRKACKVLIARICKLRKALARPARKKKGAALHSLFADAAEETLHSIVQHLSVNDIVNLRQTSTFLGSVEVLKQALPNVSWIPGTLPWRPDPVHKVPVHRFDGLVGLPLMFGRMQGGDNTFLGLDRLAFFDRTPPKISVELLFDSPSLTPVPPSKSGPALRYAACAFHEAGFVDLPSTAVTTDSSVTSMPAVKLTALSSSYKDMFAAQTKKVLASIAALAQQRGLSGQEQARKRALEQMAKRNARAQHFTIRCTVHCRSARGHFTPSFQTLSPPFLVYRRVAAKRAYGSVDGPGTPSDASETG